MCGLVYGAISGFCGPPGDSHFYANAGWAMSMPDLCTSIKLRIVRRDSDGNTVGLPGVLGLPYQSFMVYCFLCFPEGLVK